MERLTNWHKLWSELSDIQERAFSRKKEHQADDFWRHKAKQFDKAVDKRWSKPDSSRDFLVQKLKDNPGSTLLDIGAGTGKWSLLVAPHTTKVTALEPSLAMQEVLRAKIQKEETINIDIVSGTWPEDDVAPHDYVLASHSMYGVADFEAFVNKMNRTAQKACILVMRAPFAKSVMAMAAQHVFGQPYDSPNFQIAYNILLGMDIYPDVIMEGVGSWSAWTHESYAAALIDIKNRLDLADNSEYDDFLLDLLKKHLSFKDENLVWPNGNRSALVYWDV